MTPDKVLYTARVHTTGGREGASHSSDGCLSIQLSNPGAAGSGTNPEQLFAAGWSACFIGAMGVVARKMKMSLPPDRAIDAEVDLITIEGDFFIEARMNVSLPGIDRKTAEDIVRAADQVCPYSKAIRNNIKVTIHLI